MEENKTSGDLYRVKILHSSETHLAKKPESEDVAQGDLVIVPSRYGKDMGKVLGGVKHVFEEEEVVQIVRKATEQDLKKYDEYKDKEAEAMKTCKEKIKVHKLDMKLVAAHYLYEESKILFFFTAESRVDFRELVKDLVSIFKMRIELRQIGVRDESRVLGGMAVCGRNYCCNGLTDNLRPVSIKMAKEQNLSLNSMKISGPCGRLLCCLSYEYDFYKEEKAGFPPEGSRLTFKDVSYKVIEINILAKTVKLSSSEGGMMEVPLDNFKKDPEKNFWSIVELDIP